MKAARELDDERARTHRRVIVVALCLVTAVVGLLVGFGISSGFGDRRSAAKPHAGREFDSQKTRLGASATPSANVIELRVARPALIVGAVPNGIDVDKIGLALVAAPNEGEEDRRWRRYVRTQPRAPRARFDLSDASAASEQLDVEWDLDNTRFVVKIPESSAEKWGLRLVSLRVDAGSLVAKATLQLPAPGQTIDVGELVPVKPRMFALIVQDKFGAPIEGARLLARGLMTANMTEIVVDGQESVDAIAITNERGRADLALSSLARGFLILRDGFLPRHVPWIVRQHVQSDVPTKIVLRRATHQIRGIVRVDGVDLAACKFYLVGSSTNGMRRRVRLQLDNAGRFECTGLDRGAYVPVLEHGEARIEIEDQACMLGDRDLDVGVISFNLTGEIALVDTNQALRKGDLIQVQAEFFTADGELGWSVGQSIEWRSGKSQRWSQLPAGAVLSYARVSAPARLGHQLATVSPQMVVDGSLPELPIEFYVPSEERRACRVLVVNRSGQYTPLSFSRYSVRMKDPVFWTFGTTSSRGMFQLASGIDDPIEIVFEAARTGDEMSWSGTFAETDNGAIVLRPELRDLTLQFKNENGDPASRTLVQIRGRPKGTPTKPSLVRGVLRVAWTDSQGRVRFPELPTGLDYRVEFRQGREGGVQWQVADTVKWRLGKQLNSEISILIPGVTVRGRALRTDGTPLVGWLVSLCRPSPDGSNRPPLHLAQGVVTSGTGDWSFPAAPRELCLLLVHRPGSAKKYRSRTFDAGAAQEPLILSFDVPGR